MPTRNDRNAFSVKNLLIAIVIIIVLLVVLLPALKAVREAARRVSWSDSPNTQNADLN